MNDAPLFEPRRAPPTALIAAVGALLPLLYLLSAWTVGAKNVAFGIWFTEVFIFFGASFVLVRLSGRDPVRYAGASVPAAGPALYGYALGAVNFFAVAIPILAVAQLVFPQSWVEANEGARVFRGRSPIELVAIVAGVTIAAPIAEEYCFRGVLQKALLESGLQAWRAIAVTAVVFSAMHFDPVGFVARVELGLLFGWLFLRTGSIWPGVFAHSANNLVTTVLFFAAGEDAASAREIEWRELLVSVALPAAMGLSALGGLLFASRAWPSLLASRAEPERVLPPPKPLRVLWPWLLAAAAALAGAKLGTGYFLRIPY